LVSIDLTCSVEDSALIKLMPRNAITRFEPTSRERWNRRDRGQESFWARFRDSSSKSMQQWLTTSTDVDHLAVMSPQVAQAVCEDSWKSWLISANTAAEEGLGRAQPCVKKEVKRDR